ncbi:hypothetical protein O181_110551, partial [Austropuccinia psidii MF-1]|nr:hypothetical protein [Austropuccinia psidii MF-1]
STFIFNEEALSQFQLLKEAFTTAPISSHFNPSLPTYQGKSRVNCQQLTSCRTAHQSSHVSHENVTQSPNPFQHYLQHLGNFTALASTSPTLSMLMRLHRPPDETPTLPPHLHPHHSLRFHTPSLTILTLAECPPDMLPTPLILALV